jgi:endoglucanase
MVSNNPASTSLDSAFFAQYDTLVQAALRAGGYVILDLHNYARWNGGVVGQGGPTDANVSSLGLGLSSSPLSLKSTLSS